jgi:uncharacterized protein (TIGR02118 family)
MICLSVLYGNPQDTEAFDRYYNENHIALASKLPGLKAYNVIRPISLNPNEKSPYHLIALLYFEDMAAMQQAFASPEGQAAAGDLPNFATGGVTMLAGEQQILVHNWQ